MILRHCVATAALICGGTLAAQAAPLNVTFDFTHGAIGLGKDGRVAERRKRGVCDRRHAREIDEGERIVVGVNKFAADGEEPYQPLRQDPSLEAAQAARLARLRHERAKEPVARGLSALKTAAEGDENVLYPLRDALRADATLGEVCDALRDVWGEYQPREI